MPMFTVKLQRLARVLQESEVRIKVDNQDQALLAAEALVDSWRTVPASADLVFAMSATAVSEE